MPACSATLCCLLSLLALGACTADPAGAGRPNILLISIDSLRADEADGVDGVSPTGPRLRALAGESVVFTRATSTAPWTTPSMMSVLTGLFPWSHHVREHNYSLSPEVPLLSERLSRLGYSTAAIVPSATLADELGFSRGFDVYSNEGYGHDVITSPQLTSAALQWLSKDSGKPFFCWIHYWDPHFNYLPHEEFEGMFPSPFHPPPGKRYELGVLKNKESPVRLEEAAYLRSQYEGELRYTDRYIGELLDSLEQKGLVEKTLVVILADHGEGFQEHGWLTHTMRVYEEMTRVPLILRWTGKLPAGRRVDRPVSLVNVAPTILDLIGENVPAGEMEGRSLVPLIEGRGDVDDVPVVSETIRQAAFASWRARNWKYILNLDTCAGELYELDSDPAEKTNLAAADPKRAGALRRAILSFYRDRPLASRVPVLRLDELPPERLQQLRSLGYVQTDRFGDVVTYRGKTDPLHCSE